MPQHQPGPIEGILQEEAPRRVQGKHARPPGFGGDFPPPTASGVILNPLFITVLASRRGRALQSDTNPI